MRLRDKIVGQSSEARDLQVPDGPMCKARGAET
mgnify:CR=1 FL=1